ncbi:MAG: LysM peptidoglycan-binding domain-containing protein [Lachnospiraceae bacterium]|nr:LysM peptidoglycan-binding domain-containing protein [Lachnospiraceae bacterium]
MTAHTGITRTEQLIINSKRRRNRELQRHITILVLTFVLIIIMTVLFFGTKSMAAGNRTTCKCYASVQIEPGDTLYGLADRYYSSEFKSVDRMVKEIMSINNMNNDVVISGLYIIIPYYTECDFR